MGRKVTTPVQATAAPVCEGFIVGAGDTHASQRQARKRAQNAVGEILPGQWEVTPLSRDGRDFEVRRQARNQKIPMGSAWELCRRLEGHRDIFSAEPELILPGIHPGPSQVWPKEALRTKSARASRNLPCSREAPLLDTPPAAGMKVIHAGTAPLVRTGRPELDEFMDYFPGVNANRLQSTITRLLKADAGTIGGQLAGFGEELLFHIATNPEIRAAIAREAAGRMPRAGVADSLLVANRRLKRQASPALMRLLAGK